MAKRPLGKQEHRRRQAPGASSRSPGLGWWASPSDHAEIRPRSEHRQRMLILYRTPEEHAELERQTREGRDAFMARHPELAA
jgi:hypothetical protein